MAKVDARIVVLMLLFAGAALLFIAQPPLGLQGIMLLATLGLLLAPVVFLLAVILRLSSRRRPRALAQPHYAWERLFPEPVEGRMVSQSRPKTHRLGFPSRRVIILAAAALLALLVLATFSPMQSAVSTFFGSLGSEPGAPRYGVAEKFIGRNLTTASSLAATPENKVGGSGALLIVLLGVAIAAAFRQKRWQVAMLLSRLVGFARARSALVFFVIVAILIVVPVIAFRKALMPFLPPIADFGISALGAGKDFLSTYRLYLVGGVVALIVIIAVLRFLERRKSADSV